MSLVFAEYFSHYAADFAFGCISFNSFEDQRHQVNAFISAACFKSSKGFFNFSVVTASFQCSNFFSLQFANRAVYAQQVFRGFFFLLEFVNANDNTVAFFNVHLPFVSGILNFFLDVAFSNGSMVSARPDS